jgi:tetratricopeptide (TPR) repeat protein
MELFEEADHWCLLASKLSASDDVLTQILWRATRAKLLARTGELDEAAALAREAVRRAEKTDGLNRKAKAFLDLAEVLRFGGKPAEAAGAVEAAFELYSRKGNLAAARRARALLAERAIA